MSSIGLNNKYKTKYLFYNDKIIADRYKYPEASQTNKTVYFYIDKEVKVIERSPSSLVDALSRLGGILAIVNFTFLISFINERYFSKEVKSIFDKQFSSN
jgi:hypothetical protein